MKKNQQFQNKRFEVNYQAPSNGISQTNSTSLFELDVCDYGKCKINNHFGAFRTSNIIIT
jgi:hypothetical protein